MKLLLNVRTNVLVLDSFMWLFMSVCNHFKAESFISFEFRIVRLNLVLYTFNTLLLVEDSCRGNKMDVPGLSLQT